MEKVALVTGCSSPLGLEITRRLKNRGFLVYGGTSSQPRLDSSLPYLPLKLNVTRDSQIKSALNEIVSRHGRLDVLVNVAGLTPTGPLASFNSSDFSRVLDVNVVGPFRLTTAALPWLTKSKGMVINISSLSGFFPSPNFSLYSASKHALNAWAIVAALELKKLGVRVISLVPGAIKSSSPVKFSSHTPARAAVPFLGWLLPLTTAQEVASRVIDAIDNPPSYPLVLVGRDSYLLYYLQKFLPASVLFSLQSWLWQRQL